MTTSGAAEELWEGDVNDAVVKEWKADTTTFDRVRQVIDVTTEPQAVSTIAERARVSEPTARKHLSTLVETGHAKRTQTDSGVCYMRAPQMLAMRRIAAIHREHTRVEIRAAIQDLKDELSELRAEYGATDPDELVLKLDSGDDGWDDLTRWQQVEQNLDIAQAALALYDFDPDDSQSAAARITEQGGSTEGSADEQGALSDDTAESTT